MMNDTPFEMTYNTMRSLCFEDLPAESEQEGFGRNAGSKTRSMDVVATTLAGVENNYQVRITRYEDPLTVARRLWENAESRLNEMQATNINHTRLMAHAEKTDRLHDQYRVAKKERRGAAPDKLAVKNLGRSQRQQEEDAQAKADRNACRAATPFLTMMFEGTDIEPNATQWELMADFLEGVTQDAPFFFMGAHWLDALERGGAVTYRDDGKPQGDKDAWRKSYQAFQQRHPVIHV